jgi:hypothetical protein
MLPLAEVQSHVRDALVAGDTARVMPLLVGGRAPHKRLAVHQRHYQASLVSALLTRFPATAWLMGDETIGAAAHAYVRAHPPAAPCIAEFGATFPDFIAAAPGAAQVPYLRDFAVLEWHLGHAAVAVEYAAMALQSLAGYPQDALADLVLRLQPGMYYFAVGWPVDDLIRLHLEDRAPERYGMEPAEIWLEIRGARGAFQMTRRDAGSYLFRRALQAGQPIGAAAEAAIDADAAFDPGRALAAVMREGLVTAVETNAAGVER